MANGAGANGTGRLAGRAVLVTGGGRGIGAGIARVFAAEGARLLIATRTLARGERVARDIRRTGGEATAMATDVAVAAEVRAMVAEAGARLGGIDIVCHNAGIFPSAPIARMSEAQWDRVLDTNLKSLFLVCRAVLPQMAKRGFGRVVVTSSISGPRVAMPGWSHYCASKAGVNGFVEAPPDVVESLRYAAERVRVYHELQLEHGPRSFLFEGLGQTVRPIARAGVYMAGSAAVLPSSVLHTALPGAVAGVPELAGVTAARPDGSVHPLKLVAAGIAGVGRVFRASGAQAVAALALGTETIPRVDKVFGPGNLFVTLAKRRLFGEVGIDALYGPTETLVIADDAAPPDLCAADLLAQAEHDALATPVLVTTDRGLAEAVREAVEAQLASLERAEIARAAVERGGAVVASDLDEAVALANEFAPEHCCLLVRDPAALADRVTHAGGVFVGEHSPEVLGDYVAGPSHVMPTGGSARWASPLSVLDFLKITSVVALPEDSLALLGPHAARLARAEGLTGHARSIERRIEGR